MTGWLHGGAVIRGSQVGVNSVHNMQMYVCVCVCVCVRACMYVCMYVILTTQT